MQSAVTVKLFDPGGVLVEERDFTEADCEALRKFVGDFAVNQGLDPEEIDGYGLAGSIEFEPVEVAPGGGAE